MAGAGTAYDLFADRMGSITHVVDTASNTIAAEYTYDSFGNRIALGTLDQRYGFTAREVDDETGLIYFRARHYDPSVGQFIQQDPIGFAAGDMNLYAYVWNNPYTYTDPSGEAVTVPAVILYGGITGLAAIAMLAVLSAMQDADWPKIDIDFPDAPPIPDEDDCPDFEDGYDWFDQTNKGKIRDDDLYDFDLRGIRNDDLHRVMCEIGNSITKREWENKIGDPGLVKDHDERIRRERDRLEEAKEERNNRDLDDC